MYIFRYMQMFETLFEINPYVIISVPLAQDITKSKQGSFVD